MVTVEYFFLIMLGIQLIHSIEELSNKFHERFPLFRMTFRFFLTFEALFFIFWVLVYFIEIPAREHIMKFFILLMFANGVWHITWYGIVKKYVPGLITAPLFVITFMAFYYEYAF